MLRRFWPAWLVPAALAAVLVALWAVVAIPPRLVDTQGLAPADRLRAANDLRATLLAVLGGMAVIAGAIVAALNFRESSRQRQAAESQLHWPVVEVLLPEVHLVQVQALVGRVVGQPPAGEHVGEKGAATPVEEDTAG